MSVPTHLLDETVEECLYCDALDEAHCSCTRGDVYPSPPPPPDHCTSCRPGERCYTCSVTLPDDEVPF